MELKICTCSARALPSAISWAFSCYQGASCSAERELKLSSLDFNKLSFERDRVVGRKMRGYWPDIESLSSRQHVSFVSRRETYSVDWQRDFLHCHTTDHGLKTSEAIPPKQAQSGILIYHCVCEVFKRGKCAFLKMTVKKLFFQECQKWTLKSNIMGENRATK